jgi:membrane-bound lytic murein transglycosylase A
MFRPTLLGRAMTTGYFEIDIVASRTRGGPYQWPLLRPPRDPQRYSRGEILGGALAGQGLEILWFASAADLYFVQLQGSARVRLTDGSLIRVGGAAQNGRPSVPVAQLFRNAISGSDLSIPGLRAWSAAHPAQAQAVVSRDAAYFFMQERHVPPDQGPPGALGVPLTPLRSVAVDRRYIPLGAPVWLDTRISATGERLRRLMLAQDSGEPISGPAHIDVFFGPGAPAEAVGGRQHADADVWVLLPR